MTFKVIISLSAKSDVEDAAEFYSKSNPTLVSRFFSEFAELIIILEQNPFFQIKFKTVKTFKLKSFPYVVLFFVNEDTRVVTIFSVLFGGQKNLNFGNRFPI